MSKKEFNFYDLYLSERQTDKEVWQELKNRRPDVIGSVDIIAYDKNEKSEMQEIFAALQDKDFKDIDFCINSGLYIISAYVDIVEFNILESVIKNITGVKPEFTSM